MSTVSIPPDSGISGDPRQTSDHPVMSTASNPIKSQLISSHPESAANADQLGEAETVEIRGIESTGVWDAYDVWRRFIKDARARRHHQDQN